MGHQYTPILIVLDSIDPFGPGLTGDSQNLFVDGPSRMNNSLIYSTAGNLCGFDAALAYGFGKAGGNTPTNRQVGFSVGYANGPLLLALAHHNTNNAANTNRAKVTLLGGTYDFDMAKAHLAAGINKGVGTIDSRDWLIGISVPFGASSVFASYIRKDDRSAANRDASQAAIGYSYAMSKRTNLYASYSASASTMAPPIR
jgi:predicted porin